MEARLVTGAIDSTYHPPFEQRLGRRRREKSEPASSRKRRSQAGIAPDLTPHSTQACSIEPTSEASGHSKITTPEFESNNSNTASYEFQDVSGPRQNKGEPKAASVQTSQAASVELLKSYIPLGSLTLCPKVCGGVYLERSDWTESSDIWLAFHDTGPLAMARSLANNKWIRVFARKHQRCDDLATIRMSVLPDDVGRRYVDRNNVYLRRVLVKLVNELDTSLESWEGVNSLSGPAERYRFDSTNDDSLFYLFNTLPSPAASPSNVSCPISNDSLGTIFGSVKLPGLNTRLYPYQKRTVATMIKREVEPARALDPRLATLHGPTGQIFYYDPETGTLLLEQRAYDEAKGGILGESMGLGKTLVCLATIVATKGHWPEIPPEHSLDLLPVRAEVGSLMQMAAAAVGRSRIPWRAILGDLSRMGEDHENCLAILENNIGSYVVPGLVARRNRRPSTAPEGKTITLSTATLIIVPQNLLSQWRSEIAEHVEKGSLKVFCLESDNLTTMPSVNHLLQYDIILMSRQRFEREMVPTETARARSKTENDAAKGGCSYSLDDDYNCSIRAEYESPLKGLHFLRIIMDEGHEFSSSGRQSTAYWALQMLHVDRRWVVSGTPANGLVGVEVGATTYETSESIESIHRVTNADVLEVRRKDSALSLERKDLEKLGVIVAGFLQVKPWANSKDEDPASWHKYIMPYKNGRRKVRSLKTLLESLVVRHRIEDIEADISLPPLHNRVVYLQPSWHDKLSINLFILSLTANAVTSERVDEDYMFHPKNRRQLNVLIQNLRQSGFYWTSFSPEDVAKTLKVSRAYYDEHGCLAAIDQEQDKVLIETAIGVGELVLQSTSWRTIADLHEMGMFVEDFPEAARGPWALVPDQQSGPLLIGATQLTKAQQWVDSHLYVPNPSHGLAGIGTSTMQKLRQEIERRPKDHTPEYSDLTINGDSKSYSRRRPISTPGGVPKLSQKQTVSRAKSSCNPRNVQKPSATRQLAAQGNVGKSTGLKSALKSALKRSTTVENFDPLPAGSPLEKTKLSGTASAKLSYLLDRVSVLHQEEKILIFYEGDHIAWYIAQALDLIDIRYLIYTKTLSLARQNAYITTFNTTSTFRVLLMNVHQAAHGLHIASASRVFFVNPVWQPNVEAQAIKRAHRIGQTRPVYVETLVLKDTLEDQMLQRRKGMTAQEHQKAERSLLDDDTMSTIIKNARFIPLLDDEIHDVSKQIARLHRPQRLFGRPGKGDGDFNDPDADLIFPSDSPQSKKNEKHRSNGFPANDLIDSLPPPEIKNLPVDFAVEREAAIPERSNPKLRSDSERASNFDIPPSPRKATHLGFSTGEVADTSVYSIGKQKSDSERGPDLDRSAPPGIRLVGFNPPIREDGSPSRGLTADASSNAKIPTRRVGFDLGGGDEELRSLFGEGTSADSASL